MSTWNRDELDRYARHLVLPQVGPVGQDRLRRARVLVVGAGGLGSPVLLYLAAAGVGQLGVVEQDQVDVSNLQRQVLFDTAQVGQSKAQQAVARLRALNPHPQYRAWDLTLTSVNALEVLAEYQLIIDCTDNLATRYLLSDACVILGKPLVYGAIHQFEGQVTLFDARSGPCYRCLFPEPPPLESVVSCAEAGVLGVLPGVVGSLMATEALKYLLQLGTSLQGRLLFYDALAVRFHDLHYTRDPHCPACSQPQELQLLPDYSVACELSR